MLLCKPHKGNLTFMFHHERSSSAPGTLEKIYFELWPGNVVENSLNVKVGTCTLFYCAYYFM